MDAADSYQGRDIIFNFHVETMKMWLVLLNSRIIGKRKIEVHFFPLYWMINEFTICMDYTRLIANLQGKVWITADGWKQDLLIAGRLDDFIIV